MADTKMQTPGPRKLRILMLHGYTQSGHLFQIKTKALKKSLERHFPAAPKPGHLKEYPGGVEFVYPTAPIHLDPRDIPGYEVASSGASPEAYGWWRFKSLGEPFTYSGMAVGFKKIAQVLREEGPFDGAIGFSQGAAAVAMVASMLEPGRQEAFEKARSNGGMSYADSFLHESGDVNQSIHPPLKFAIAYSGFGPSTHPLYKAFYEPKIATPMFHFIGSVDTVVSEDRSLRLADACIDGRGKVGGLQRVAYHPGGHFFPSSQKQYTSTLVAFIRDIVGDSMDSPPGPPTWKEESVEEMCLPF